MKLEYSLNMTERHVLVVDPDQEDSDGEAIYVCIPFDVLIRMAAAVRAVADLEAGDE